MSQKEVSVIGAGAFGCSKAYHLAKSRELTDTDGSGDVNARLAINDVPFAYGRVLEMVEEHDYVRGV